MTRPVLRAPFLRWLPLFGAVAGAATGTVVASGMSDDSLADIARLAGLETPPDPVAFVAVAAIVVGSVCWATFYLIWGKGGPFDTTRSRRITVRRVTTDRLAPAPWPIGTVDTVVAPPRERSLPVDLDQPLSAFDPHAIPTVSFESIRRSGLRPIA